MLRAQITKSHDDFRIVEDSTLALFALIIGFALSMAASRFDQRKSLEQTEANSIGIEYSRGDLLPPADAARVRTLRSKCHDERILFYTTRKERGLAAINAETAKLEGEMWAAAAAPATTQPSPTVALAVAGMNEVIDAQGFTQAAWLNRVPIAA